MGHLRNVQFYSTVVKGMAVHGKKFCCFAQPALAKQLTDEGS